MHNKSTTFLTCQTYLWMCRRTGHHMPSSRYASWKIEIYCACQNLLAANPALSGVIRLKTATLSPRSVNLLFPALWHCRVLRKENISSTTTHCIAGLKSGSRKTPGQLEAPWQSRSQVCSLPAVPMEMMELDVILPLFLSREDAGLWKWLLL